MVNVTDQTHGVQVVNFNQSDRFVENKEAEIPIMIPEGASASLLKCKVTDPDYQVLRHEVSFDRQTNLHHVRFMPVRTGRHRVDVEYDKVPVEGSPFILNIEADDGYKRCVASGPGLQGGGRGVMLGVGEDIST